MIKETLIALYRAGRAALANEAGLPDAESRVTQVRAWEFAWPVIGAVHVRNGSTHNVYVGGDAALARHLGVDGEGQGGAFPQFLQVFTDALVSRMPTQRPIGRCEVLSATAGTHALRGMRSFVCRLRTTGGALYVMADLCSRGEFEAAKDIGYEETITSRYLPVDLASRETLSRPVEVDGALTAVRKLELDLQVLVPGPDSIAFPHHGILQTLNREQGEGNLVLSLDMAPEERRAATSGQTVEASFGISGRVFHFQSRILGSEIVSLSKDLALGGLGIARPRCLSLGQRRREFRVAPDEPLPGWLQVVVPAASPQPAPAATAQGDAQPVTVIDLSFSGAGMLGDAALADTCPVDSIVQVRFSLPGHERACLITGIVRRSAVVLAARNRRQAQVGVEFQVRSAADRQGMELIGRYVMAVQRTQLAKRNQDGALQT